MVPEGWRWNEIEKDWGRPVCNAAFKKGQKKEIE